MLCVCIVTKHLFPMQFLGTLPLCTEDAFVLLILTYLTIIAGKDVTWCELRFLSFASKKKRYFYECFDSKRKYLENFIMYPM